MHEPWIKKKGIKEMKKNMQIYLPIYSVCFVILSLMHASRTCTQISMYIEKYLLGGYSI